MRWMHVAIAVLLLAGALPAQEQSELDAMKRHFKELVGEARKAKERGEGERSQDLMREAGKVEAQLRAVQEKMEPRERDRKIGEMKARLQELEVEIGKAKEQGQGDRAEKMAREADEIRGQIRKIAGERRDGQPPAERERIKEKIQAIHREAEAAAERGQMERAEDLRNKARAMERELEQARGPGGEGPRGEDLIDRIAQLRKEAIQTKREGKPERARNLWEEADRLDMELRRQQAGLSPDRDVLIPRGEGPGAPRPPQPEGLRPRAVQRQPGAPSPEGPRPQLIPPQPPQEDLRKEIDRLRREIQELREILNKALEGRRPDKPK